MKNKYLYNGKELQEETQWLDYGARMYDPACACWHNIDPHAESYVSISSYAYVANNPLKYVDPDGRDIVIRVADSKTNTYINYTYKGDKVYDSKGNEYKGNNVYVNAVKGDLNQLKKDDGALEERINTLDNSTNKHTIEMTASPDDGNVNTPVSQSNDEKGIPTGTNTKYNPNKTTNVKGEKRVARAGLAHELLGHGYDSDQGKTDYSETENGIPMHEVNAVNIENKARAAAGDPKKTTYGGLAIPKKLLDDTRKNKK